MNCWGVSECAHNGWVGRSFAKSRGSVWLSRISRSDLSARGGVVRTLVRGSPLWSYCGCGLPFIVAGVGVVIGAGGLPLILSSHGMLQRVS